MWSVGLIRRVIKPLKSYEVSRLNLRVVKMGDETHAFHAIRDSGGKTCWRAYNILEARTVEYRLKKCFLVDQWVRQSTHNELRAKCSCEACRTLRFLDKYLDAFRLSVKVFKAMYTYRISIGTLLQAERSRGERTEGPIYQYDDSVECIQKHECSSEHSVSPIYVAISKLTFCPVCSKLLLALPCKPACEKNCTGQHHLASNSDLVYGLHPDRFWSRRQYVFP